MLLALLLASELIDGRGTHFDLGREAVAPCAALVDSAGAVRGVLHAVRVKTGPYPDDVHDWPRLDVFDAQGRRRIILRTDFDVSKRHLPLAIFLDDHERPRVRLGPAAVELLDAGGRQLAKAAPAKERGERIELSAGGRTRAFALAGVDGTDLELAERAALGRHEFGWMLSIKPAGKDEPVVLLDSDPSGWNASLAARPHLGLLYGVRPPADAKQRFIDSGGSQTPAPVVPWTMDVVEFDDGAPTSGTIERKENLVVLRLNHAR